MLSWVNCLGLIFCLCILFCPFVSFYISSFLKIYIGKPKSYPDLMQLLQSIIDGEAVQAVLNRLEHRKTKTDESFADVTKFIETLDVSLKEQKSYAHKKAYVVHVLTCNLFGSILSFRRQFSTSSKKMLWFHSRLPCEETEINLTLALSLVFFVSFCTNGIQLISTSLLFPLFEQRKPIEKMVQAIKFFIR